MPHIHACARRLEGEKVVAEWHNLNVQVHTVNDSPDQKYSDGVLLEGARRNHDREVPTCRVTFSVTGLMRSQGEGLLQIEAMVTG